MSLQTARTYLSLLLLTISTTFRQIGRYIMDSMDRALNRMYMWLGVSAGLATVGQIYLAIVTGGVSLLMAPIGLIMDTIIFASLAFLADTGMQMVIGGSKWIYSSVKGLLVKKQATNSHKKAQTRASRVHAVA